MTRIFAVTAAIAALIGTPVLAADMAVKAPPAAVATYNWTGFYLGVEGGGAWGKCDDRALAGNGPPAAWIYTRRSMA
jgi:outer membrane immunogenic protein